MKIEQRFISPAEAGRIIGLHRQTICRLIRDKKIRAIKLRNAQGKGRYRIRMTDFEKWIEERSNEIDRP